jgi:hypothetical protein
MERLEEKLLFRSASSPPPMKCRPVALLTATKSVKVDLHLIDPGFRTLPDLRSRCRRWHPTGGGEVAAQCAKKIATLGFQEERMLDKCNTI